MVRAVDERRLQVDHRVAGEHALGHRLAQALLDGRDVLLRHHAADDLVAELEAGAHLGRGELDDDVPVLAVAAGLALELVVDARRPGESSRDTARAGVAVRDRCAELALEPIDDDVDVCVAHGGEDRLAGAILATDLDGSAPPRRADGAPGRACRDRPSTRARSRPGATAPGSRAAAARRRCDRSATRVSPAERRGELRHRGDVARADLRQRLGSLPCTASRLPTRSSSRRLR